VNLSVASPPRIVDRLTNDIVISVVILAFGAVYIAAWVAGMIVPTGAGS
jgi:hypothetical protein